MTGHSLLGMGGRWRHPPDVQHTLAVEQTLARIRLALTGLSLAAVVPLHFDEHAEVVAFASLAFVYSVGALLAVRFGRVLTRAHAALLHAADVGLAILLSLLTGGAASPYSAIYLFALLAAGYRFGGIEVGLTALVTAGAIGVHAAAANLLMWPGAPDPPFVLLRIAYLGAVAALVGFMAEAQRRERLRVHTANRLLARVGTQTSAVSALHLLINELLDLFAPSRLVVAVEEEGRDTVTVWDGTTAADSQSRHAVRVTQEPASRVPHFVFPVPAHVAGWLATRPAQPRESAGKSVVAIGADGLDVAGTFSIGPLFGTPFPWNQALVLCHRAPHGTSVRLCLFMPPDVHATRGSLLDLQGIMRDVGPAVVNLYLGRRLQSRSAVVERTRISRELHDGVIQALIGVEMQLEVTRRQAEGTVADAFVAQLKHIQQIIGQEVLNVRDLMQMLRPMDVDASRLVEYLASAVEQFRQRTGIRASFACGVDEIDLSAGVCREIAGIVQEALANVRKHSEATSVLVRLDTDDGCWRLTVDDNGRGLDFEGYLAYEDVEAQRKGPLLIKERVRSIHGRLGIHSHPGFGTKLEITIPRKHHG